LLVYNLFLFNFTLFIKIKARMNVEKITTN